VRALYIGRFQPVHQGHVDVVRTIDGAEDVTGLVIAVGSTQYDHTRKHPHAPWSMNPFTYAERREMLERALAGVPAKPLSVCGVPDYHDWPRWYRHIAEELPGFGVLYSADARERAFFAAKGKGVRDFPRLRAYHAGKIREWMAQGDPAWREAVPPAAVEVLDRIGAEDRVRALLDRDRAEVTSDGR
jgi:nicotinamide-nucleotide adenylyltransferase